MRGSHAVGRLVTCALVAGGLAGCEAPAPNLSVGDYPRYCSVNRDCLAVEVGNPCDDTCEWGAINIEAADAYLADRNAIDCSGGGEGPAVWIIVGDGEAPAAFCDDGLCAVL